VGSYVITVIERSGFLKMTQRFYKMQLNIWRNKPMAKTDKFIITTPVVELGYGYLRTPDTKFNPEGDYKQDFFMSPEQAKNFCAQIEADPRAKVKGKPGKLKFTKVDGTIKFKTKQHAKIKTKGGEVFDVKPKVYYIVGGKTVEYPEDAPSPYSGTKAEIEVEVVPFEGFGGGLSLRLRAIRLLEIVEGGKGTTGNWSNVDESYTSSAIPRPEPGTTGEGDDEYEEEEDADGEERF
jgi:hypothetical protein